MFPGQVRVLASNPLDGHPIPPPTDEATHEAVLAALPAAQWAHFACHATSDLADPSASRLLLADHRARPLTVVDITRLRLGDPEFAFLSACSTAQPGTRLPDEVIHLSSAFQLAGYRHVVATLWPVGDRIGYTVAEQVYAAVRDGGAGCAAHALHQATRDRRARFPNQPSAWAAHVHAGP
jgi:CHAT domain-containing protein